MKRNLFPKIFQQIYLENVFQIFLLDYISSSLLISHFVFPQFIILIAIIHPQLFDLFVLCMYICNEVGYNEYAEYLV